VNGPAIRPLAGSARAGEQGAGRSLRVLLTIQTMEGPAGGSLYVRDIALELTRQGHSAAVYCPRLGSVSDELLRHGVLVVDSIESLERPDVIHGNSPIETAAAVLRFPGTPAIFVGHGWDSPDALAPILPSIVRYLAVSEHARDAMISFHGVDESLIGLHQNPVDPGRFPQRAPLPRTPTHALVLSNAITDADSLGAIRAVSATAGLSLDVVGLGMGSARTDPESILARYDVVFASGRSALEALATGCSVILCGATAFGELVTTQNYDTLRLRNFGVRTLNLAPDAVTLRAQLARYDAHDAARLTALVRSREGLSGATIALVEEYLRAIQDFQRSAPGDWASERLLVAHFLNRIAPTSNTFHVAAHLAPVLARARRAEGQLRRLQETLCPGPLLVEQGAQVRIRFLAKPGVIAMDGVTAVLEVANGTGSVLSIMGGYPVFLSYHWLAQDGSVACFEGVRSELFPPLPSGGVHAYDVHVTPPSAPGRYTLRVTLVQEGVVWLDDLGVFADTDCLIMPAS
jgi:Glycosyltransferase Family 4